MNGLEGEEAVVAGGRKKKVSKPNGFGRISGPIQNKWGLGRLTSTAMGPKATPRPLWGTRRGSAGTRGKKKKKGKGKARRG